MNWAIYAGIFIIAAGTLVLTYGGIIQNRKDTEQQSRASEAKLEEISRNLAELRGKPQSDLTPGSIARVEGEIEEWAETFASEKQRRKIQLEQHRSEQDSLSQHANTLAREYFEFFVSIIRNALASYAPTIPGQINSVMADIPKDLFLNPDSRYEATIGFPSSYSWDIAAYSTQPSPDVGSPIILLSLHEKKASNTPKERGELLLRFNRTSKTFHLRLSGDFNLATSVESTSKPTSEYEQTMKSILRSLIEYQLLQE